MKEKSLAKKVLEMAEKREKEKNDTKKVTQRIYEEVKRKLEYGDFISTKGMYENYYIHVRLEEPVKDVNRIISKGLDDLFREDGFSGCSLAFCGCSLTFQEVELITTGHFLG